MTLHNVLYLCGLFAISKYQGNTIPEIPCALPPGESADLKFWQYWNNHVNAGYESDLLREHPIKPR